MASVEELIDSNPNLRIVHLIRDPRLVMLSRRRLGPSSFGLYSTTIDADQRVDTAKEAKLYCSTVLRDVRERRELQAKYPGVIREVIFDEFMLHPMTNTQQLYNFIDMTFTKSTESWLHSKTRQYNVTDWQDEMTYREEKDIMVNCKELFADLSNAFLR